MKKIISFVLMLLMLSLLVACAPDAEDYISGTEFEIPEFQTDTFAKFQNKNHGIIIEYPERLQRLGNFDLDGYICFEENDVSLRVYIPDTDTETIMSVEEYATRILKFPVTAESENIKYGKSTGYKAVLRKDGDATVEFIVKGVDGFYRFSYTCLESNFEKKTEEWEEIFATIRIDDGVYNKLGRMAYLYKELLEYATSMQYVTDANYANHCLNNFEISSDPQNKTDALNTYKNIKEELNLILNYERDESEPYGEFWERVISETEKMIAVCDEAIAAIERGDTWEAQKLARISVTYELSDVSSKFLSIINAEIAEY